MQLRPIRSQLYLPVLRFGITDEDWGIRHSGECRGLYHSIFAGLEDFPYPGGTDWLARHDGNLGPAPQSDAKKKPSGLAQTFMASLATWTCIASLGAKRRK